MAAASAAFAAQVVKSGSLDLKWSLTLRVVAVALVCFLVAAALALYGTRRELRQANENLADLLNRQLQVQLFRIEASIDAEARFPDWEPVMNGAQRAGQCVQYLRSDGSVGRSSCVGVNRNEGRPPAWFSALGAWLFAGRADAVRPVSYRGKAYGTLLVTTDSAAVIAAIWKDVSKLLGLTALVIAAICLLQYVAISRALRPTKDILAGLDNLSRGDLSCRLPDFHLVEFQRISDVFNTLAATLDQTRRERTALAARLVDKQEQEWCHLARELHDELAQTLSAISATAASIRATVETECPALVAEAERLLQMSSAMMRSLRSTLQALRPPEIADFGLAASLLALAKTQERLSGGRLKIILKLDAGLDELPTTAASHIYRIVQEGLTNISKHAHASRARVALDLRPELPERAASRRRWLSLTIEDDGCGAGDQSGAAEDHGLGLVGMRERATALGGQLDVAQLDRGFRLQAFIPFGTQAEALS